MKWSHRVVDVVARMFCDFFVCLLAFRHLHLPLLPWHLCAVWVWRFVAFVFWCHVCGRFYCFVVCFRSRLCAGWQNMRYLFICSNWWHKNVWRQSLIFRSVDLLLYRSSEIFSTQFLTSSEFKICWRASHSHTHVLLKSIAAVDNHQTPLIDGCPSIVTNTHARCAVSAISGRISDLFRWRLYRCQSTIRLLSQSPLRMIYRRILRYLEKFENKN